MHIEQKRKGSIVEQIVGERQSGIDRRVLTHDWYIPERQASLDRRHGENAANERHGK